MSPARTVDRPGRDHARVRPRSSGTRRVAAVGTLALTLLVTTTLVGCASEPSESARGDGVPAEQVSCRPDSVPEAITSKDVADAGTDGVTLKLVTHDSFAVSDGIFDDFTARTGIKVKVVQSGDAGQLVSQAVLTAGNPVGDVLFGVDNTFLCRATRRGVFTPYVPAALSKVADDVKLADADLATPIDTGDVCVNYSRSAFPAPADAPKSLDDLLESENKDRFVTENPETSSPGMAFLLATIATYGEGPSGWERYWRRLRDNGVEVTSGWSEAYEKSFGYGSGDRTLVTSYASSPVADVAFADPPRDEPVIGVVPEGCFRQVEFAGILRGTRHPEAAAKLVDFLLSPEFQSDMPLNMFVTPVNPSAKIPAVYEAHTAKVKPVTMTPAEIEAGRDRWTQRWTEIVLR
ncbi:MAG: thiamine ABC transporter substrate-binding protein [Acidimicrobiales bacterium]|nr:thiamine ABC transporter substrate-binding protein [Acidimicrobiales bacterium]